MYMRAGRLVVGLSAALVLSGCGILLAQDSGAKDEGVNLSLHANSHGTAAAIGLPVYPGATPYVDPKDKDNDSAADIGFTFGDFHFSVIAVSYVTGDPAARVLEFYRKPLSHYG